MLPDSPSALSEPSQIKAPQRHRRNVLCLRKHTQPRESPSSQCPPSPSSPSPCFRMCPPEFINGLSRAKAFHQKYRLLWKAAWRTKARFPMLLTYCSESSRKFLRSGSTVPILQQRSLGCWPAWWVGLSGITAPGSGMPAVLSSPQHSQSRWVPAGSTAGHSCPPPPLHR